MAAVEPLSLPIRAAVALGPCSESVRFGDREHGKASQRSLAGRLGRAKQYTRHWKIKTYFGHEDKLAAEAVVRIGIIVVNLGHGHVRLVTEIANSRDF
jgi:hypothetical protein